MVTQSKVLYLEELLRVLSDNNDFFPDHSKNYYHSYCSVVDKLRESVYPSINLGLILHSRKVGLYTSHDGKHFDEVVNYAGHIIGVDTQNSVTEVAKKIIDGSWHLSAYDIYLLLMAIRFHDVGNIEGREDHHLQNNIIPVMVRAGYFKSHIFEAKKVAEIASAHTGKDTSTGLNDDSISRLSALENFEGKQISPRLIAAILRLADEICENEQRTFSSLRIPYQNQIYHKYSESIKTNRIFNNSFDLKFAMTLGDATTLWGKDSGCSYLTDAIMDKLDVLNLERVYCNRFLPDDFRLESVSVEILIFDLDQNGNYRETHKEKILLQNNGYPVLNEKISDRNEMKLLLGNNLKGVSS